VRTENRDPQSLLNMYRHLIHLKANSPALTEGDYHSVNIGSGYVYAYVRETEMQRFLVMLNFDSRHAHVMLRGSVGRWVAGTHMVEGDGEMAVAGALSLEPYEGRVYELRRGEV